MFKNILIIGFGMIGSSIARSIPKSRKQAHIYAFDKSKDFSKRLKKANLNVSSIKSLDDIKKLSIDLIILCTPVLQYENILKKINKLNDQSFIVTDVGSTKKNMTQTGTGDANWIGQSSFSGGCSIFIFG